MPIEMTARSIARVYIVPKMCIVCHACEEHCPEVFHVAPVTGSEVDAAIDPNDFASGIAIAADICPVNIIKVDYAD